MTTPHAPEQTPRPTRGRATAHEAAPDRAPSADMSHVDAHGAVDLTAGARAGAPGGEKAQGQPAPQGSDAATVRLDVPLISHADESTFDDVVSTSRTVPVVLVLWSPRALAARGALDVLESVARQYAGRFQLVEVDADASPAIVQAFQAQTLPAVVALVGGRPVPLFQGTPVKEQVTSVIDELLGVAAQMGVTGGVVVTASDTEAPTPEEHLPALAAEESGDLDGAVEAWQKVVERNPRDEDAKAHLARVRIARRSAAEPSSSDDPADQADQLFQAGNQGRAFDLLLGVLANATDADQRDRARLRLLDLFRVAGNTEEVRRARRRLSTLLMV